MEKALFLHKRHSQIIHCQILFILTPKADHSQKIALKVLFVLLKYFSKYLEKCDLHNNLEHSVVVVAASF